MTDEKKTLIIEGKEVEFTNEPNLLEVIRKAGMNVPTFCYRPDLTSFGACRMCVVEVEYPNGRKIINSSTSFSVHTSIRPDTLEEGGIAFGQSYANKFIVMASF